MAEESKAINVKTALAAALGHYAENKRQSMEVPEWLVGGKPLKIYWQLQTIHQARELAKKMEDNADMVVLMAQDENGNPLFPKGSAIELRRGASMHVVSRIAARMGAGATVIPAKVDEAEGN